MSDVVDVLRFCVSTVVEQLHGLILSLLSVLSVSIVYISDFALLQIQRRHSILLVHFTILVTYVPQRSA